MDGGAEPTIRVARMSIEKTGDAGKHLSRSLANGVGDWRRGSVVLPPTAPSMRFLRSSREPDRDSASDPPTVTVESKPGGNLYSGMIGPKTTDNTAS